MITLIIYRKIEGNNTKPRKHNRNVKLARARIMKKNKHTVANVGRINDIIPAITSLNPMIEKTFNTTGKSIIISYFYHKKFGLFVLLFNFSVPRLRWTAHTMRNND